MHDFRVEKKPSICPQNSPKKDLGYFFKFKQFFQEVDGQIGKNLQTVIGPSRFNNIKPYAPYFDVFFLSPGGGSNPL